jgi:AcrR family transcriptional regulator
MSGASISGPPRRRDAEAKATRDALVKAALELFTRRGYSGVGTEEIVARADVTRGALYHHFKDKRDLFRAVHEQVESDLVQRVAARMERTEDPWEVLVTGTLAFLDACDEPAVKQIALTDAPVVLGWKEWREIDNRHGLGLTRAALQAAVDAGVLRPIEVDAMAHLFVAALTEAALVIANAKQPHKARDEVQEALLNLAEGLRANPNP